MELENIHLATLALTALVILYADHQGFDYLRGKRATLEASSLRTTHRLMWAGLLAMIGSGVLLAAPRITYLLSEPAFYIKMGLVAVLVVNAIAIGQLSPVATERSFRELSVEEKRTMLLSATLSGIGWVGAAVIGYFFL